jgi:hypothetical protein
MMHILDENKFSNYKEMRGNMTTGKITFDCHWKRMALDPEGRISDFGIEAVTQT